MRVLDTSTKGLTSEDGEDHPYAILSHTWGSAQDEVTLQELRNFMQSDQPSSHELATRPGYVKISKCCDLALSQNFARVWIDTCCIDKTSSAELSEAINSMYRWYKNAVVCYVYLDDVSADDSFLSPDSQFRRSRWFTRGWTLQELIAPPKVLFYSKTWTFIGERDELAKTIESITRIPVQILVKERKVSSFSVAQRMSWASQRQTKREEDIAYCMLGIFDVNMPLIYGEKHRAFYRLQEAIIANSTDESIFAWGFRESHQPDKYDEAVSILAMNPSHFAHCHDIVPFRSEEDQDVPSYEMTKRGVCIEVRQAIHYDAERNLELIVAPLQCRVIGNHRNLIALVKRCPRDSILAVRFHQDSYERSRGCPPLLVPWSKTDFYPFKKIYMQVEQASCERGQEEDIRGVSQMHVDNPNTGEFLLEISPEVQYHELFSADQSLELETQSQILFKKQTLGKFVLIRLGHAEVFGEPSLWIRVRISRKISPRLFTLMAFCVPPLKRWYCPYSAECSIATSPASIVPEVTTTWGSAVDLQGTKVRPHVRYATLVGKSRRTVAIIVTSMTIEREVLVTTMFRRSILGKSFKNLSLIVLSEMRISGVLDGFTLFTFLSFLVLQLTMISANLIDNLDGEFLNVFVGTICASYLLQSKFAGVRKACFVLVLIFAATLVF